MCVCVCVRARARARVRAHVQSCPTLWDSKDYSLPGSSVHGIFQARILEQVSISSSRWSSWPRERTRVSCISCIGRLILYPCTNWEAPSFRCTTLEFNICVPYTTSPGWMHETSAQGWCTGKTQRDQMGKGVGGGIGMGNTCKSMADSCQCMAKTTTIL